MWIIAAYRPSRLVSVEGWHFEYVGNINLLRGVLKVCIKTIKNTEQLSSD